MQFILIVLLAYPSGDVKINSENPPVFYSSGACKSAQEFLKVSTPRNASVTINTACLPRGRD